MNNSEILFLYDAKFTNPNGDPDEENRPRMDSERDTNLVSDLRLKRYIRDYLIGKKYELFVQKLDGNPVTAEKRIAAMKEENILDRLIDVRLFGATMPIKNKKNNRQYIGPVQFNWGYSLNKVELLDSSITSHFLSKEGNSQGAIGKDYRVKYSFIAFSGVISGKRGENTRLKEEDINILDEAMVYSIPDGATRSKIGQYPRLYLRVEYKDNETVLGDLRDYINLKEIVDSPREVKEVQIDIGKLVGFLGKNKERIQSLVYYYDDKLVLLEGEKTVNFKDAFKDFNLKAVK